MPDPKDKPIGDEYESSNKFTPLDDKSEDPEELEDFLEHEAPEGDKRTRYSSEYGPQLGSLSPEGTDVVVPDNTEIYPEEDSAYHARGGNIEGSLHAEQTSGEEETPEGPIETPDSEGYAPDWKGGRPEE